MDNTGKAFEFLKTELESKEKRTTLSFNEFMEITSKEPTRVLRNIFQLFHDMVRSYVGEGINENPDDPESIGFVKYDCSKIFVEGADNPFFADRLFANRFIRQLESLGQGSQQNRIYAYDGPHGCGKSTFLNNLLRTFEKYTNTKEGQSFEIFWEIATINTSEQHFKEIGVPCPSHDHPILLIPKKYRIDFLNRLLSENMTELKHRLSCEKEYEWIFRDEVCTICNTLFWALFDKLGSLDKVLKMVKVRPYKFDRRLGEGISIFNPGDRSKREISLSDKQVQDKLDQMFGTNLVRYVFSPLARTNNGIYVLMDIKSHNKERLLELHNVISEGVHRVDGIEEHINSLFFALMNPEDKKSIEKENAESLQGRIQYNKISYVMEVLTEVKIYRSIFGEEIDVHFLPKILENFARVIISSRMNTECKTLKEWVPDLSKYKKYCDENGLLLRMEIYGGIIPPWISEEDRKKFTAKVRRKLIAEAENEGDKGFSGRESIRLFSDFFSRYGSKPNLINMLNVTGYFKNKMGKNQSSEQIPPNFIDSLVNWYNYVVLNEVKESLYFYNKEQISEDILNYLCTINYDPGNRVKCQFTGKDIEVTIEFFKLVGGYISGKQMNDNDALYFARDVQKKYAELVAQGHGEITETELYQELFNSYVKNLKKNALQPFFENENFREAIKFFRTKEFDTFDTRLKEHISYMINNLVNKFGYTDRGAKEIVLYVIDKKLVEKFSK